MSDEDAFLRAIQATPNDQLPRLVYADWLEEHGRTDLARWVRYSVEEESHAPDWTTWSARFNSRFNSRSGPAWFDLYRGLVPMCNAATLLALGRLQGLLAGFAWGCSPCADLSYYYEAHLFPLRGTVVEFAWQVLRIPLDQIDWVEDWDAHATAVMAQCIGREHRDGLDRDERGRRVLQTQEGCESAAKAVLAYAREILTPTEVWWFHPPAQFHDRWGVGLNGYLLADADWVLFLHFADYD